MSAIDLRPMTLAEAGAFVTKHHRHHKKKHARWSVGAEVNGELVGVVVVGNPVAVGLNNGKTFEVLRLCVVEDAPRNTCSRLLGAAWRASKAMGVTRLVSYLRADERGHSYTASGWRCVADVKGREWNSGNKSLRWLPGFYEPTTEIMDRTRWEIP